MVAPGLVMVALRVSNAVIRVSNGGTRVTGSNGGTQG